MYIIKSISSLIILAALAIPGAITPARAEAGGVLYLELKKLNELLEVTVMADSGAEAINAIGTEINYPASILRIEDVSATESFCDYFIENEADNSSGKYKISCVTPSRTRAEKNTVVKLYFRILGTGQADIDFSDNSLMLKSNGQATNILSEAINSRLYIN